MLRHYKVVTFSKPRLEAVSDGIFSIAMTLLAFNLKVPTNVPAGQLGLVLLQESSTWAGLVITFFLAARYWTLQHRLFSLIDQIRPRTVVTTFIFLFLVTILPFSTSLWGAHLDDRLAFFLYILNQTLIGAVVLVEVQLARRQDGIRRGNALWILSARLYVMVGSLFVSLIASWFLHPRYVGMIAVGMATITRRIQGTLHKRYLKLHPEENSEPV